MASYKIIPRRGRYFLESVRPDGSREDVEEFASEAAAVQRLRQLQLEAEKQERPTGVG